MRADQWVQPLGRLSSFSRDRFSPSPSCSFSVGQKDKGERGAGGGGGMREERERPNRSVCAVLIRCNAVPRELTPPRHLVRAALQPTTRGTRVPSARLGDAKTLELIGPRSRRNLRKVNRIGSAGWMRTYLDAHATRVHARSSPRAITDRAPSSSIQAYVATPQIGDRARCNLMSLRARWTISEINGIHIFEDKSGCL